MKGLKVFKFNKNVLFLLMTIVCIFSVSVISFASSSSGISPEEAEKDLTRTVYNEMVSSGKTYPVKGGGYMGSSELFVGSAAKGYDLDEAKFSQLTGNAQSEVVSDIAKASNNAVGEKGITDDTVTEWWKHLQSKDGVGSKFLAVVLEDTNPDFATAKKWYQPFSGPIGVILALGAILAMGFIGIVIVCDIFYMTIPPVRLFVDDKKSMDSDKLSVASLFSYAAISAVREVETDMGGSNKSVLGIYLKKKSIELLVLSVILLYLVQGQIYSLIGSFLDLLSGITG